MFYAVVGSLDGQCKTTGGGWRSVGDRAAVFPITEEPLLGGLFDLYQIIDDCISTRTSITGTSDRFFFLGVKKGMVCGTNHQDFYAPKSLPQYIYGHSETDVFYIRSERRQCKSMCYRTWITRK